MEKDYTMSEYVKAKTLKRPVACAFMARDLVTTGRHDTPTFCAKKSSY
jgi:hypothetical protein